MPRRQRGEVFKTVELVCIKIGTVRFAEEQTWRLEVHDWQQVVVCCGFVRDVQVVSKELLSKRYGAIVRRRLKSPLVRLLEPGAAGLQQVNDPIGQALFAQHDV